MKMVIEPSSATVVAAVLKDGRFKGKKVCCIISGGNIDMGTYFSSLKAKLWYKLKLFINLEKLMEPTAFKIYTAFCFYFWTSSDLI